jgi:ABC-type spermidine/putrescine transport system permease subunit I
MDRAVGERRSIEAANPAWLGLALTPAIAVVVCLVLYPLALAVWSSVESSAGPTLARYVAFFSEAESYRALLRTVGLALATTLASIMLSIPLGYIARAHRVLGVIIRTLVALPLAVPVLIAGYALTLFYSENGLFNTLLVHVLHLLSEPLTISYTWAGLVIACTWRFFPYTALLVISALDAMDRSVEEAAASTGAAPWQVFGRITLPLIAPATLTGAILTFVSTFGTFSIPLLMGRGQDVLSVVAYRKATGSFDWPGAATIVLVMAVVQIAVLVGARRAVAGWTHRS